MLRILSPRIARTVQLLVLTSGLFGFTSCVDSGNHPDEGGHLIFFNGPILSMRPDEVIAPEAVLVQAGRIVATGSRAEIFAQREADTELVDLQGQALLPGFIGVHTHPDLAAFFRGFVDLSGFRHDTPAQVWEHFDAAVRSAQAGDWVLCRGFDPMLVPGLRAPTLAELNRRAPDNPVFIIAQNLHAGWANSRAFAELDIAADTPDPAATMKPTRTAS